MQGVDDMITIAMTRTKETITRKGRQQSTPKHFEHYYVKFSSRQQGDEEAKTYYGPGVDGSGIQKIDCF